MVFVVLCPGKLENSIGSGSSFKVSRKTGPQLEEMLLSKFYLYDLFPV